MDHKQAIVNQYDFYQLGFTCYVPLSSEHNMGISTLIKAVKGMVKLPRPVMNDLDQIKFGVVGRPNVGKSSLVNAILKEERVIVGATGGTTRDAIDLPFTYEGKDYLVIDTAGIRKRGKVYEQIEKYSVLRALKAIDRSDVCLLVLDAKMGIIEQDKRIASYILGAGKAVVIVINKW